MYSTFKHEKGHIAPGDPGFSWVQARIAHVMKTQMGPSGNVASINIYIYRNVRILLADDVSETDLDKFSAPGLRSSLPLPECLRGWQVRWASMGIKHDW